MSAPTTVRRFTVREYHRMAEAGILTEDDRVELLRGEVVEMEPVSSRHAACVDRLNRLLGRVGDEAVVRVQSPIRLDERSEPEPDVALLRPDPAFYAEGHPGPGDVLLVVEVADTSRGYDREVKLPLYARAGVREAWVVDLEADEILKATGPDPEGYGRHDVRRRGDVLSPESFSELELAVEEILG